jgi:hypothetical protein
MGSGAGAAGAHAAKTRAKRTNNERETTDIFFILKLLKN